MSSYLSAECFDGDHLWHGGGICSCGARLRCMCGQFVTEDGIEEHLCSCPSIPPEERYCELQPAVAGLPDLAARRRKLARMVYGSRVRA